jgi:hypothetical protein
MPTSRLFVPSIFAVSLLALGAARVRDGAVRSGPIPLPVSPGTADAVALVEARCPTFSWSGVEGAAGYELLVVPAGAEAEAEEELRAVVRTRVPGSARSYTPALGSCLERGGSYGWLVRALDRNDQPGEWSEARAIEVAAGPDLADVESALEILRAHLADAGQPFRPGRSDSADGDGPGSDLSELQDGAQDRRQSTGRYAASYRPPEPRLRDSGARPAIDTIDTIDTLGVPERIVSAAAPDPAGPVSISVAQHLELAATSALVQDGDLLLWSDGNAAANAALGHGALRANTVGEANTALGKSAMRSNVDGSYNVAAGASALVGNVSGSFNVALGAVALKNNLDGDHNVALGTQALFFNTSGSYNTALGDGTLAFNTTGVLNTAIGEGALGANLQGNGNTAVGHLALAANTVSYGTAVGARALRRNTTGLRNTALGDYALYENVTDNDNTAVGSQALRASNGGANNTAVGAEALPSNTTGNSNTAVGEEALFSNTTGNFNTAVGEDALRANQTGSLNTAVGHDALDSATGSGNIALGEDAGQAVTTGSFNIMIGNDGQSDDANTIRIGDSGHDETFIAGIEGVTIAGSPVEILGTGQLGVAAPSSRRFKRNVRELDGVTEALMRLRPVRFRYRPELVAGAGGVEYGLIAEEVAEVLPELVRLDREGRPLSVRYQLLAPLLLSELQRQERTIRELRTRVASLERRGNRRAGGG